MIRFEVEPKEALVSLKPRKIAIWYDVKAFNKDGKLISVSSIRRIYSESLENEKEAIENALNETFDEILKDIQYKFPMTMRIKLDPEGFHTYLVEEWEQSARSEVSESLE